MKGDFYGDGSADFVTEGGGVLPLNNMGRLE